MAGSDEIYVRYKSYGDVNSFASAIRDESPVKIDIGAIYPCPVSAVCSLLMNAGFYFLKKMLQPADRSSLGAAYLPIAKELVFDIDISDYDDVRHCCKGADICGRCWPLMTVAIRITDQTLRGQLILRARARVVCVLFV